MGLGIRTRSTEQWPVRAMWAPALSLMTRPRSMAPNMDIKGKAYKSPMISIPDRGEGRGDDPRGSPRLAGAVTLKCVKRRGPHVLQALDALGGVAHDAGQQAIDFAPRRCHGWRPRLTEPLFQGP